MSSTRQSGRQSSSVVNARWRGRRSVTYRASVAGTQAADLRTRLDLLLGEQVMIVAKESAAAVNHSDDYAGYTALLTANSSDLADLMRRAFGNSAAAQLAQQWNVQNGYLVDYAIAVVTHNDGKASCA